jgi:5-methylcytosine-specific restriction endonuclease McrA
MTDLPEPMTPADSRFRNSEFMPFPSNPNDYNSDWFMLEPRIKSARIQLMQWSWNAKPVCSLNNCPAKLWRLAGERESYWKKIQEKALSPWILCSDNRLYHPWLAEQANRILRTGASSSRRLSSTSPGKWKALRAEVFLRDDFTCRYCGDRGGILECDHIIPVSRGGSDAITNLVTACEDCNRRKNATISQAWGNAS